MRYPIVRQHDASDCGPAALAMIGAFHKKRLSIARIREAAATDRNGTSLAGLFAAAEAVGFSARAVKATAESIGKLPLPAIAHWREDNRSHFVVVYKVTPRRVVVGDPSIGLRKLDRDRFIEHWTGVLLLVSTNPGVRAHVRSGRLISLLLPHRRLFLDALLAAVLMTILGLTSSFFIQALVDFVFVLEQSPALNLLSLGMLVVLLARVGFQTLRTYLLAHLSLRIDADTVMGFHRHLLGLPLSFFTRRKTGEILSRMNDAIKIRTAVTTATLCVIVDGVLVSVTATVMLWVHWKLALIALGAMPALAAVIWWTNRSVKSRQQQAMERAAEVESCVVETLGAIQLVKASRAETRMQLRAEARFSEMLEATYRAQLIGMRTSAATIVVSGVSSLAVLCLGGHEVLAGSLTVGQLMGFHTLLAAILTPIERLASVNQPVLDAIIAAERLGEVFELDGEVSAQRKDPLDRPLAGAIDFEDVTCRYGANRPVFEHVSFKIAPGECIGVTGASGGGKTTVVNLLTRFLEPSAGRITLDNVPLTDYALDCIRRDIAVVPQDIVLLHASIADNIRLGLPSATAAQIHAVGQTARLDKLVAKLPMGYDTVVGERGLTLSGGERQRVAIARAILSNPAILVLDEPTSHLDAESAIAVDQIISSRRGIQTTVVISHRPMPVDRYISLGEHTSNRLSQMQSA